MINATQITDWFNEFNNDYFNNQLPLPTKGFDLQDRKSYLGQFQHWGSYKYGGSSIIRLTTRYDLCEEDARKILIHEMVHMWEWVNGYKCGHLTSFKMKAAEINRKTANKYKIARFTDLSSNSPLSAKHRAKPVDELPDSTGIIITYDCGCGRRLIKSTPNNYNELIDKLKCYGYTMNDIHIYKCKGQIISTYCKSVKKIHKYFLSTDTFENKIKPTIINEIKYKTAA